MPPFQFFDQHSLPLGIRQVLDVLQDDLVVAFLGVLQFLPRGDQGIDLVPRHRTPIDTLHGRFLPQKLPEQSSVVNRELFLQVERGHLLLLLFDSIA
ncbi:MAG: hypothetical protein ACK6DC_19605 [Planctomycetota bacterium]